MKRFFIIFLVFSFVSGCDDDVASIDDREFENFQPGEQTLSDTKSSYPNFSKEFVWHSQGGEDDEEAAGAQVTLVYHTRHGHYFLRYEDGTLIHKRKIP